MEMIGTRPVPRINIESDAGCGLSTGVRDSVVYTKCKLCQKMDFHCRHCKHRCHRKCPGHTHQSNKTINRRNGGGGGRSKIFAGEEQHWTKVLQANEIVTDFVSCPYHGKSRRYSSTIAAATDSRADRGSSQSPRPAYAIGSRGGGKGGDAAGASAMKGDKTFFHTLYSRFCQWIDSARKDSAASSSSAACSVPSPSSRRSSSSPQISRRSSADERRRKHPAKSSSSSSFGHQELGFDYDLATLLIEKVHANSTVTNVNDHYQRALSSSDSEELGSAGASYSSTCSSLTVTSTSTTTSDCCLSCGAASGSGSARMSSDCSNFDDGFLSDDIASSSSSVCRRCANNLDLIQQINSIGENHNNTWYLNSLEKDEDDDRDAFDENHVSYYEDYLRESLIDWNIPIADVELGKCLRTGFKHDVFRGRWHGDVFVYCFVRTSEDHVMANFLREVTRLSKIRHENICLFMGAALQIPNLAIITSELKGTSVYEKLHISGDRIPMRNRVNIGRQVAQALGYLHAKGISAQVLNSRNVYLEPKVKLSLLDQGMAERENTRLNEICVPRGNLCFLAPELLRQVRADSCHSSTYLLTAYTDIFAFGTLLYELLSGQFPFHGHRLDEIIYKVCTGQRQTLENIHCNSVLKILIERCWANEEKDRPPMTEINLELQQKTGLHKRHSSSQPERLDRQNSFTDKCLL